MRVTVQCAPAVTGAGVLDTVRRARLAALLRRCGDDLAVASRASLAVRLGDDAELRALNARFLGTDAPTDVLAFPADDNGRVGDLAISVERALRQGGDDPVGELRLLAVHGLLHCLGHDHADPAGAAAMTAETRRLLPDQVIPALAAAGD